MGLQVRIPNAFTKNKLGMPGKSIPFPFGVTTCERINGVDTLSLHPQALADLCDILEPFETLAVFEVSDVDYVFEPMVLSELAASQNVDCQAIDDNAIVIAGDDLANLLLDFDHYNFHVFDGPKDFTRDEIVANLSSYRKWERSITNPLLPHLWLASFFLDSHDDCYLYLEAYDLSFLKQIFERALQIYAGTVLAEESGFEGEIARIPSDLIETLWPVSSGLTILRSETRAQALQLRIGVSETEFSFQERKRYPIAFFVEYDALAGGWRVSK